MSSKFTLNRLIGVLLISVRHNNNAHVRLIQRVGEGLRDVFFNHRNAFELMDHDGLLSEFYGSDSGFGPAYYYMQEAIAPIMHRHQKMDILEIGKHLEQFDSTMFVNDTDDEFPM